MGRLPRWLAVIGALAVLGSCGRKAAPLPPVIEVPETTTDLWAYQDGGEIVLSWSYPQLTRAGRRLIDLGRVEVLRMEVPPGQDPVGTGAQADDLRRQLLLGRGTIATRLEGQSLQDATRGSKLEFRERLPVVPPGTTMPVLWYALRSRRLDGTPSALSNIVTWKEQGVPTTPGGLVAHPERAGITLSWEEVSGTAYVVERRPGPGGAWEVASPVGVEKTSWTDTKAIQGDSWTYRVRALVNGTVSPPSAELVVPYPDVYPPTSVSAFICLPEPGTVRLRWDPSAESVATYAVVRRVPRGEWQPLAGGLTESEFVDERPPLGDIEYAVRVIDAAGNQSEPVTCRTRTGT